MKKNTATTTRPEWPTGKELQDAFGLTKGIAKKEREAAAMVASRKMLEFVRYKTGASYKEAARIVLQYHADSFKAATGRDATSALAALQQLGEATA